MDNFFKLRADNQQHIIDSALKVFSQNGYKKASIGDIAEKAGISKGMITYYFGSKKTLYLYLAELCGNLLVSEMEDRFNTETTDFFEKILAAVAVRVNMIKKYSSSISFFSTLYSENDPEVKDDVRRIISDEIGGRMSRLMAGTDLSNFKEEIDISLLNRFISWAIEGFSRELQGLANADQITSHFEDFTCCIISLKDNLCEY